MPLLADPPPWNATPPGPTPREIGKSVLGNSITLHGARQANVLVMAGVHGDESEAVFLGHLLLTMGCPVPLIPCANPDGALLRQRWNRNNVDLNRNLPSQDWTPEALNPRYPPGSAPASEPETQAFLTALDIVRPTTILSLHSYKESFIEIERGPEYLSAGLNGAIANYVNAVGVERRDAIGYPTPGAMGSFGWAVDLLVLTYELKRGTSHEELSKLAPPLIRLITALDAERWQMPPGMPRQPAK